MVRVVTSLDYMISLILSYITLAQKILVNKRFRDEYFELEDKIKENFKKA